MHQPTMTAKSAQSGSRPLKVALLVPNEALATGLETLLGRLDYVGGIHCWQSAQLLESLTHGECDVLIIAADQWDLLGEANETVAGALPRVLVLGDQLLETHGKDFSSLPSDGFLSMAELSLRSLDNALQRVISGEIPMPPHLARYLLAGNRSHVPPSGSGRSFHLTGRERETLALLADGLSNKQIARSLGISTHGAKRLVGAVLLKLGSPNRTAAVVTAMKTGLV
ncbi:helix-turn-helix transcriptional regulator [Nonomuraea insulae]|uniref:LuxR C-terminal-related transcriptional regulator n=1 Tax=Nonomuraea insulae TaxID=1616787 RepID=A0ABW1D8I6_9ACTN